MDDYLYSAAQPWNDIRLLRERIQELEKLHEEVQESWQFLLAREEQFRKITESAPDAIVSLNDGGRVVSWNTAAEKMFGFTAREVVGRDLARLAIAPRFREKYESILDGLRTQGQSRVVDAKVECQAVRKGGVEFPVEVLLSGVSINGQWQATALIRDDTERRSREADIRQLTAIIGNATDAITVQDFAGQIIAWNRSAERLYGWSEAEALGMTTWDLVPQAKHEETAALFSTLMHGGDRALLETQRMTSKGDVIDVLVNATVLTDEAGTPVAVATTERDISDRGAAEQELRQHFAEMTHMARMNSVGEFVTELANELSQPVSAIMANARASARMLESGKLSRKELSDIIEEIAGEGSRTGDIIRRLQEFVRSTSRQRHTADLNEIVQRTCHLIDLEARPRGCKVRLNLAPELPAIMADEIQLQQVVLNLVRNGLEAMDENGADRGQIELTTSVGAEGEVQLTVRDTGGGISAEIAHRIFEPLFTTKPKFIGLGLSVARSVAEAHGGSLELQSETGLGCVFRLSLPGTG